MLTAKLNSRAEDPKTIQAVDFTSLFTTALYCVIFLKYHKIYRISLTISFEKRIRKLVGSCVTKRHFHEILIICLFFFIIISCFTLEMSRVPAKFDCDSWAAISIICLRGHAMLQQHFLSTCHVNEHYKRTFDDFP